MEKFSELNRWPNFFIVGAPKAATTSLYYYLKKIPQIYMSPIKEPNYFSVKNIPDDHPAKPIRDKKKYLDLFRKAKNEIILGEASTTYLADENVPKLIHKLIPNARILISLRDPVERAFSEYLMLRKLGVIKVNFHEDIQIALRREGYGYGINLRLIAGLYSESVQRYLNTFGSQHVKIIIFEEFVRNSKSIINEILDFLELDVSLEKFEVDIHNPFAETRGLFSQLILRSPTIGKITEMILSNSTRKFLKSKILEKNVLKPKMGLEERNILVKFYQDDVRKLKQILARDLPWINF